MQLLDAHALLAELPDEDLIDWFPEGMLCATNETLSLYAPMLLTGGISLSGMLDDAASLSDLREAWDHFTALLNCEVVSWESWGSECRDVFDALQLFARQFDRAEELN